MTEGAFTTGGARPAQGPMRPLGVGEVLDAAIKLYTRNAVKLWKIVAVLIVPIAIINQIVISASLPDGAFVAGGTLYTPGGTLGTPAAGVVTEIVLTLLAALIVHGALALCLVDAYIGKSLDWRDALREAASRLGSLLWLAILYSVLVILGFVAIILPGIWLVTVWSVCVPALMFEHLGGFKALGRSFDLVRGRWWATFAALLVSVIMLGVVLFVVGLIIRGIDSGLSVGSTGLWLALNAVSGVVADLIAFPFIAAVICVMYIDLRVRKEALDLELLAGALDRTPTAAGSPGAFAAAEPADSASSPPTTSPPQSEPPWPPAG